MGRKNLLCVFALKVTQIPITVASQTEKSDYQENGISIITIDPNL